MDLQITIKGIDDKTGLRILAEECVAAALDRFSDRIHDARVLLEDETGPHKQVVDKRCRIEVRLKHGGEPVVIDETGTDLLASLAVALDRLKAAMSRKVGKAKRGIGAG